MWTGAAHAHGQVKNNPGARAGGGFIFSGGSRWLIDLIGQQLCHVSLLKLKRHKFTLIARLIQSEEFHGGEESSGIRELVVWKEDYTYWLGTRHTY